MSINKKHLIIAICIIFFSITGCKRGNESNLEDIFFRTVTINIESTDNKKYHGTGVIIDNNSILTVAHLFPEEIDSIKSVSVRSADMDIQTPEIEKIDRNIDLALLKVSSISDYERIDFSNENVAYSDNVMFFGNTNGYGLVYREGYVTKHQTMFQYGESERNVFFISNTVNMGDSGSPVFDNDYDFIGILSFKLNSNYGQPIYEFSAVIPVDVVLNFLSSK